MLVMTFRSGVGPRSVAITFPAGSVNPCWSSARSRCGRSPRRTRPRGGDRPEAGDEPPSKRRRKTRRLSGAAPGAGQAPRRALQVHAEKRARREPGGDAQHRALVERLHVRARECRSTCHPPGVLIRAKTRLVFVAASLRDARWETHRHTSPWWAAGSPASCSRGNSRPAASAPRSSTPARRQSAGGHRRETTWTSSDGL